MSHYCKLFYSNRLFFVMIFDQDADGRWRGRVNDTFECQSIDTVGKLDAYILDKLQESSLFDETRDVYRDEDYRYIQLLGFKILDDFNSNVKILTIRKDGIKITIYPMLYQNNGFVFDTKNKVEVDEATDFSASILEPLL